MPESRPRGKRIGRMKIWRVLAAAALAAAMAWPAGASGDPATDCFSEDLERRIDGCTALIEQRDQGVADLSLAYAMRALAYSLKGRYATAISDYDAAISLRPDFAVALNNRAWAYFRWGKAATGLADVEKSLELSPTSPHTLDTRAHIRQALGDPKAALARLRPGHVVRRRAHDQALPVRADRSAALHRRDRRHLAAGADPGALRSACSTRAATPCRPTSSAAPPRANCARGAVLPRSQSRHAASCERGLIPFLILFPTVRSAILRS